MSLPLLSKQLGLHLVELGFVERARRAQAGQLF